MVGNWLYGVAHQAALQARRSAARRRAREVQVTEMPDTEAPQERWADVQPMLDEELSRLPDHYRAVIVLCDLEGENPQGGRRSARLSRRHGGEPVGAGKGDAGEASHATGCRLVGRALAAVLSQNAASAGVPASVVMSTIKAASLCAAGQAVISVKVAALAEGVLKAMLLNKLKPVLAVLVVVAMAGVIGFGIARGQQRGDVPQKQTASDNPEERCPAEGREARRTPS